VIDPGPVVQKHLRAQASAVEGAETVSIVLTHGHADHAACASALAERVGATVWGHPALGGVDRPLADGDSVPTDAGALTAIDTPGHAREHLSFHWPERRAVFVGDLLLGRGDTTWVGEYPGCVADYLGSLSRLQALDLRVIYPTHGPPLEDPVEALARFGGHRRERIRQVRDAMRAHPGAERDELLDVVYGARVPEPLRPAALQSLGALVEYVRSEYPRA
jgi:glyoxylase-like metal-dependent hydrolase (beta-lactamase superfamily II)